MTNYLSEKANDCVYRWANNYYSAEAIGPFVMLKGLTKAAFLSIVSLRALEALFEELYNIYQVLPYNIFGESLEDFLAVMINYIIEGLTYGIATLDDDSVDFLRFIYGTSMIPGRGLIPGKIGKNFRTINKVKDRINLCFPIAVGMGIKEAFENQKNNQSESIVLLKDRIVYVVGNTLKQEIIPEIRKGLYLLQKDNY